MMKQKNGEFTIHTPVIFSIIVTLATDRNVSISTSGTIILILNNFISSSRVSPSIKTLKHTSLSLIGRVRKVGVGSKM